MSCESEEGRQARLGASRPAEPKEGPVAPMDCSKARGPWVVLTSLANTTALLRRAAVPAPALALALAAAAIATVVALGAAIAGHMWVVWTSRGGYGSESMAPAWAGAARAGSGEEGGAGDRLFVIGETELL